MNTASAALEPRLTNKKNRNNIFKRFWKTRFLFLLFLPALVYYVVFHYIPMWGVSLAFMEYSVWGGLAGSTWVGLDNFKMFFNTPDAYMATKNTLLIGFIEMAVCFPITIVFSLLLNEIRSVKYKKVVQTVSYLPHFLSTVVICGLITTLLDPETGGINMLISALGGEPIYFMTKPEWFRPIWVLSDVWKNTGWSTIVYLAAISSVDPGLYEAARLDGAGRIRQMTSITIPSILPTIITMLILKFGHLMGASMEKAMLLGGPYEVATVLSLHSYRLSFGAVPNYGLSTAIGLFTSLVNLSLLLATNYVSEKVTDNGIL